MEARRAWRKTLEVEDRDSRNAGVKNEPRIREVPLSGFVVQTLTDLWRLKEDRTGSDLVIDVPSWWVYSDRVERMLEAWNTVYRIPAKDIRNTLPTCTLRLSSRHGCHSDGCASIPRRIARRTVSPLSFGLGTRGSEIGLGCGINPLPKTPISCRGRGVPPPQSSAAFSWFGQPPYSFCLSGGCKTSPKASTFAKRAVQRDNERSSPLPRSSPCSNRVQLSCGCPSHCRESWGCESWRCSASSGRRLARTESGFVERSRTDTRREYYPCRQSWGASLRRSADPRLALSPHGPTE
ncbi:MAG: hypothetical protein GHCLOJNM_02854 [bacterium]|nr:hypothetical protein [bacterium]